MRPFWITFYSYKGGVGRSLALANTAALLVKRGRRVVLIDFDLEAPGLDSFDEFRCVAGKPGVVEYVTKFKETMRAPDIEQFVHPCDLPGPLRGKLWIMPAGKKDPLYNASRAQLNWADLYEHHHGEQFVENWKAAIARKFQPDYVFVDSRTGLTDVGGICTLHLPDLVVMMFALNEQNVRGVAAVAKTIRDSDLAKLPQIHYVASPVPNLPRDKKGPLVQRLTAATEHLGAKIESSIRYQQLAALSERLFVLDPDLAPSPIGQDYQDAIDFDRRLLSFSRSPLVQDYNDLLGSLIDYNRSGLDFIWNQTQEAINKMDSSLMERLLSVFEQEFPGRPEGFMARALLTRALGRAPGDIEIAKDLAMQALQADPTYDIPFHWLVAHHRQNKDFKSALLVCNTVLTNLDKLSPDRRYELQSQRGHIAMAAGDAGAAQEAYSETIAHLAKKKRRGDMDPELFMIQMFNDLEAARRSTGNPQTSLWSPVTDLFKVTGEASAAPLAFQANRWQAMHIPFALTGDLAQARQALHKARQAAQHLGPTEDIFSVKTYTEVPVKDFLKINDEMLAALDRGQLWDGMTLPTGPMPPAEAPTDPET
jgi:tetratricopeptide (TPR) repeat protein